MIEYAFANLTGKTSYISDNNFADRGTWVPTGTYNPPLDVVDYNNGKFITLVQNINTSPLNDPNWSLLVIRGTVNPNDPFDIANTALTAANSASVLALSASGTAAQAYFLATEAMALAMAGTNLAQAAYNIATSGTVAGTNMPIPSGTNLVFVAGLNLGYTPSSVVCTVQTPPASGSNFWATVVGPPTSDGFTARLNGSTDTSGYFLNWLARR